MAELLAFLFFYILVALVNVTIVRRLIRSAETRALGLQAQLRAALVDLVLAGEALEADQSGATDPRCGDVQPITVEEGKAFSTAMTRARRVLAFQKAEA